MNRMFAASLVSVPREGQTNFDKTSLVRVFVSRDGVSTRDYFWNRG